MRRLSDYDATYSLSGYKEGLTRLLGDFYDYHSVPDMSKDEFKKKLSGFLDPLKGSSFIFIYSVLRQALLFYRKEENKESFNFDLDLLVKSIEAVSKMDGAELKLTKEDLALST